MRELFIGTLAVVSLVLFPGCAHVREAVAPYLPKIEMGAADKGFGLQIDTANLGINQLCLKPDGKPFEILSKIPVVGKVIIEDLIGVCEVEEAPAEEAAPVAQ